MADRLTLGALELRKLPDSLAVIAEVAGVSQSYVSRWRSGSRTPAEHVAVKLAVRYPQITPDLWAKYPIVAPTGQTVEPDRADVTDLPSAGEMLDSISVPDIEADSPVALGRRLLNYARIAEQDLRRKLESSDPTVLKDLADLSNMPIKLGKLLGHTLSDREILDSACFRDLTVRTMRAIESFPNAGEIAKAIQEALEVE